MSVKIVTDKSEVDRLFIAHVKADRVENCLWYRNATILDGNVSPYCVIVGSAALFMWSCEGFHELWGGHFLDRQDWPFDKEETDRFCNWLPKDSSLEVFVNDEAYELVAKYGASIAEDYVNELRIKWKSWDECNFEQRNGKRRADLRKHLDEYSSTIRTVFCSSISSYELHKMIEWSLDAVPEGREWNYSSPAIYNGTRSVIDASGKNGALFAVKLYDGEKFVGGAIVFSHAGSAYICMVHSDKDNYPWLGKRLYKDLIESAILRGDHVISGGWSLSGLKKTFKFASVKCWRLGEE